MLRLHLTAALAPTHGLRGDDFVTPDDVQAVAHDVLRHRIIVSFEAEANGIDANAAIDKLIDIVPVV